MIGIRREEEIVRDSDWGKCRRLSLEDAQNVELNPILDTKTFNTKIN